jgi:drug/metabolite transporter (DMT)-like permease
MKDQTIRAINWRATVGVLTGAIMISFAAVFVQLSDVGPTTSGFYRMLFGAGFWVILLMAIPQWRGGWQKHWASSFLIAIFFCADIWFWHQSIFYIGPGLSTLLANFQVFILTLAGVVFFKEYVHPRFMIGLGLAMAGLWLLFGRQWAILSPEQRMGVWLGLLTATSYALYLLSLRGYQMKHASIRPEARLMQVTICCGALLGVLTLLEGQGFQIPNGQSLWALLALGFFCQVLGWLLITKSLPILPAAVVGLLLLIQPAASVLWDVIFFSLSLPPQKLFGALLALMGIYLGLRSTKGSDSIAKHD